ncbi:MAG: hypothetical protein ACREAA_11910 [Candidatus Polarisedimenticolia bacterium]
MTKDRRRWLRIAGAALAAGAALLLTTPGAGAYTLITRDGHRIESTQKPEVKGTQVLVRLAPHGRLAMVQESLIDWARTQAANPAPRRMTVPSDAKLVEGGPVIKKTIVGDGGERPAEQPGEAPKEAKDAASTERKQPSPHDEEAILALRKEHSDVKAQLETARARKDALEKELAGLKSRQAEFASDATEGQRRIRELEGILPIEREAVSSLEKRLDEIRSEIVEKGGKVN